MPLVVNCQLLFSIAEKLPLDDSEKEKIDGILSSDDNPAFLVTPIRKAFSFAEVAIDETSEIEFDGQELRIPVSCVSDATTIKVNVVTGDEQKGYIDWTLKKVERPTDDFSTFEAVYTSKEIKDYTYKEDSVVTVEIQNGTYINAEPLVVRFKVDAYKDNFLIRDTIKFVQE